MFFYSKRKVFVFEGSWEGHSGASNASDPKIRSVVEDPSATKDGARAVASARAMTNRKVELIITSKALNEPVKESNPCDRAGVRGRWPRHGP